MKKVLSLVLAVMMAVGMSTAAFAASALPSGGTTITVSADLVQGGSYEYDSGTIAATAGALTLDTTASTAAGLFSSATASTSATKATVKLKVKPNADLGAIGALVLVFNDDASPAETLTVNFSGSILDDQVPTGWKITGFNTTDGPGAWSLSQSQITDGSDGINKTDYLPITADMFTWEYKSTKYTTTTDLVAAGISATATLRSSQLSNVGVRKVYQKGTSGTIRDVDLQDSDSRVRVRTTKFYAKTGDTDVELKLGLTYKSKTSDDLVYEYSFNMVNSEETIEEGQIEAYSYGPVYQKAEATVRDVVFEGDEDGIVFATKTVVKGQKYYFNVDSDLSDSDAKIIADNPEVDSIYTVYQVNMANATVQFKDLDREYYVYNAEGKLLGTTKDSKLALASKYILTTAKVNLAGEEEPVDEASESEAPAPEASEVEAPPMGGGEVVETPTNNYNPNTGC